MQKVIFPLDTKLVALFHKLYDYFSTEAEKFFIGEWEVQVFLENYLELPKIDQYIDKEVLGSKSKVKVRSSLGDNFPTRSFSVDGHTLLRYSLYLCEEADFEAVLVLDSGLNTRLKIVRTEDSDFWILTDDKALATALHEISIEMGRRS
jgi:hypothetical protein